MAYNAGVTDADARTNTSSANYQSGYNAGYDNGLVYARTTCQGYLVTEGYERGETMCRYDVYSILSGTTITFSGMRTDTKKKVVVKNSDESSTILNSGYTNASSVSCTLTYDTDIHMYLYSETGNIQYAYFTMTR